VVHRVAEQLRQDLAFDLVAIEADRDPRLITQYGDGCRQSCWMGEKQSPAK
jgi:hypothetical protein